MELDKKENENRAYIIEHIENVNKAFQRIGRALCRELDISMEKLYIRVKEHDKSKWSDEEFDAYRNYFFPCEGEEKDEEAFQKAWEHHYRNNSHHPQYWEYNGIIDDMPAIDIAEMLLDWEAMSIKFGGSTKEYYLKERMAKPFSDKTREILDRIVHKLF